ELRTKVRAKYLRLLEEEQFEQLPAHTYIKGFLRAYADTLGLDGQLYVDEYNSRFVVGDDEAHVRVRRGPSPTTRTRSRRRGRRESRVVAVALSAIVLVTALVIAAWKFGGPNDPHVRGITKTPSAAANSARALRAPIVIRAMRGASYLEVRRGTSAGTPLFSGTLEKGDRQLFTARRIWISIAAPRNVTVTVFGKRFAIPHRGEFEPTARS